MSTDHPLPSVTTPSVTAQAEEFARTITETACIFSGDQFQPFIADILDTGSPGQPNSALIEVSNQGGFMIFSNHAPRFRIDAHWSCSYDGRGQWMRINSSRFHVFSLPEKKQPIFRYEYDNQQRNTALPTAHIHFHGQHPDMNHDGTFDWTETTHGHYGRGSARAKRMQKEIQKGKKTPTLSQLHFPVGGTRFRPILEDILLMLIEEYGAEPQVGTSTDAISHLEARVLDWRLTQVQAVVRDMPSIASATLQDMGYQISPPKSGTPPDKPEKLAQR